MKQNRVFIISDKQFPHGDAGGNRIEYMAKSFAIEGICPVVISLGTNNPKEYDEINHYYNNQNIIYKNASVKKSFIDWYILSGFKIKNILSEFAPEKNESIILYSTNPIFVSIIKVGYGNICKLYYDVVEWDDYSSFRFKKLDPHYWMFRWVFYGIFPKGDGIIAISKNIEHHFKNIGCKTFLYPICLDSSTLYRGYALREKDTLDMIYPGNPENKDDVAKVIKAISCLSIDLQQRLRLHFTSVSKKRIKNLLKNDKDILNKLSQCLVFHPWLEYEDLIRLYYEMDALILFRLNNQVCRSNFPSKVPELLSCGIFIIANNVGDFFDYLHDGVDSIKINNDSIEACITAIKKALSLTKAEKLLLSSNAVQCAKNKFDYRLFSKGITEFIMK